MTCNNVDVGGGRVEDVMQDGQWAFFFIGDGDFDPFQPPVGVQHFVVHSEGVSPPSGGPGGFTTTVAAVPGPGTLGGVALGLLALGAWGLRPSSGVTRRAALRVVPVR